MLNNIVAIDDDEDILFIIHSVLIKSGYNIITDTSGDFLLKMNHEKTGLIILDINLKEDDGRRLCEVMKNDIITNHIPVIFVSAIYNLQNIFNNSSANGFLSKPFDIYEFINIVEKHFIDAKI